jgi:general secretion pathway protein A
LNKAFDTGIAIATAYADDAVKMLRAASGKQSASTEPAIAPAVPIAHTLAADAAPAVLPEPEKASVPEHASQTAGAASAGMLQSNDLDDSPGAGLRDRNDALRKLAQHWNAALPDGQPCEAAAAHNLHCYVSSAGFAELRLLDRPAILTLRDRHQKNWYVLLTRLADTTATLQIGDASRKVSLVVLARYFRGEFATFWHAPRAFRELIEPGDKGDDVDWIAAQLAKLNGMRPGSEPRMYDQKLRAQVREFQAAQGLYVDGIVGPATFMYLNRVAGVDEPRLRTASSAAGLVSRE